MNSKLVNRFIQKIIIFSYLLFTAYNALHAQSVRYEIEEIPYTQELKGFKGTSILQDSDGFMWFGSDLGLLRYDGYNFKKYVKDPLSDIDSVHKPAGLVSDNVSSLIEDSEGTIWFINGNDLLMRFNRKTETFKYFIDTCFGENLWCVMEGKDGYLWLGSDGGLSRFDKKKETFINYFLFKSEQSNSFKNYVNYIYEDNSGNLWLRHIYKYGGSISIFNKETESFEHIKNKPYILDIYEDKSDRMWITSRTGLYQYNRKSKTFQRYLYFPDDPDRLPDRMVMNIVEDDMNHFWISTDEGIYQYSQNLKKISCWQYLEENKPESQLSIFNKVLYIDNAGTIWYFIPYGISKITKRINNIIEYKPGNAVSSQSNLNNRIYTITTYNDFYKGVYMLDREAHTYTKLIVDPDNDIENFGNIITDHTGKLWVTTRGRGLYRGIISEDGTVKFENVFSNTKDSMNLPGLYLANLFEDSKGRIWIEARGYLPCYYDPEQDRIIHLVNNPKSTDKLPEIREDHYYQGIIQWEMNSGILLAANKFHGIFAIIPPLIRVSEHAVMPADVVRFRLETGDDKVIGGELYQSPHDSLGIIWAKGKGQREIGFHKLMLVNYDKNDFIVKRKIYTIKDGLLTNYVNRFLEDDHGCLWLVGGGSGLTKFDPSNETFTNFNTLDGLPDDNIHYPGIKCNDGEMIFGTYGGFFISFYPDSIQLNTQIPPVMITEVKINQQPVSTLEDPILDTLITYSSFLELSYKQDNISLEYAALNYIQPNRNQYKYKLEGFNKNWVYAGNRTNVDFTNLKPGRYTFKVSGSNNHGVWNEKGAALQIIIHPPPWKTVWAYIIYGFIMIGIILWYRRFLLNRAKIRTALEVERVEKEKAQELDHMKSRFFANISHEFRTPLTLLMGPVEDLLKSKSDRDEKERGIFKLMQRNIKRLHTLINQLLDLSKLETGKIKLQVSEGNLSEFIRRIVLSFLSLAESKNIDYQYDIPDLSDPVYYDADKVEKILTNLISNAFKFTAANGKVNVKLQYVSSVEAGIPEFADLCVSDTGKGIPEEKLNKIFDRFYQVSDSDTRDTEGTGIGLALTKELVDLYRGEISVESKVGKGSIFGVRFPVSGEQFKEEEIVTIIPDEDVSKPEKVPEEPELTEMEENHYKEKTEGVPVILIVEDNIDLRNYISGNLCNSYQIITAENGKQGLELAIENIPDLVVSDLMMPVMDGIEMCKHLKTDERTNHIPVIMLTARADRASKIEGLETGADDYLIKPFDAEELQVRIKNLIEQRKNLREKFRMEFFAPEKMEISFTQNDQFIQKLFELFKENYSDFDFSVEDMGRKLHMSRTHFFRKVNAITGESPNELLRLYRMKKAAALIHSGNNNITGIMYEVGFRSASHFATSFKKFYGQNPSEYRDSIHRS